MPKFLHHPFNVIAFIFSFSSQLFPRSKNIHNSVVPATGTKESGYTVDAEKKTWIQTTRVCFPSTVSNRHLSPSANCVQSALWKSSATVASQTHTQAELSAQGLKCSKKVQCGRGDRIRRLTHWSETQRLLRAPEEQIAEKTHRQQHTLCLWWNTNGAHAQAVVTVWCTQNTLAKDKQSMLRQGGWEGGRRWNETGNTTAKTSHRQDCRREASCCGGFMLWFLWQLKANRRQRNTRATANYRDLRVWGLKGLLALLAMEQMIVPLVKVRSCRDSVWP